jgi:hypothetical protein
LYAVGARMVPCILPGDSVTIQRARSQAISRREVMLFLRNRRRIINRFVDRKVAASHDNMGGSCLIIRGDRVVRNDPPVFSCELPGRVDSIERGSRKVEIQDAGTKTLIVRLPQSFDQAAYLHLRFATCWRTLFLRRAKCQA